MKQYELSTTKNRDKQQIAINPDRPIDQSWLTFEPKNDLELFDAYFILLI